MGRQVGGRNGCLPKTPEIGKNKKGLLLSDIGFNAQVKRKLEKA
jgi:hypothetical protein